MKSAGKRSKRRGVGFLEGQLLIAMPLMSDRRFARSVIYMCAHSRDGAMGLIINQQSSHIGFPELLHRLDISAGGEDGVPNPVISMPVHVGGPVETGRGFVLHTSDYASPDSTMPVANGICLTATLDILKAIAAGNGPKRSILALGYAGWAPGQLENEIAANGWLHSPADVDIVFAADIDTKYPRALAKIGVDPSHLVADAGHA